MSRVLRIELRRSAAIGLAVTLAVIGALALFFAEGIAFSTGWMQLAMTQRWYLALLWPLALAAGGWQARRENRSKVAELFTSTPRPVAQRIVPVLGAMAVAVVAGYLAMGVAGAIWIIGTAGYLPVAVFVVTAVGALSLVAAAWLGLAVGRLLPSPMTAPALGVAGLGLLLFIPFLTKPRGWLALVFSPMVEMNMPGDYATVPGRVSTAQAVWLLALAATAVLLLGSNGWRVRVAALLPVALGAALAVTVMPHQNRYVNDAADPVARALTCAEGQPVVCVSRVHEGLLPDVTGPARQGLTLLAKLPAAPAEVHEDTTTYPDYQPQWRPGVVLLPVRAGSDGRLAGRDDVMPDVVSGAFASPQDCDNRASPADRLAAAYWLIGREPAHTTSSAPGVGPAPSGEDTDAYAEARELWQRLQGLSDSKALAVVVALRDAAQNCTVTDGLFPASSR